ncbi:hypothetical protein C463_09274 [Halorubrum californiense DSM 19288]|uniref:Uncharacterized protein n=1 Tax=Halorubrum californiense DSM 19288 TaxID=1227465 RepID=M0E7T4_9EURY|nr:MULTISPECIES: hypothetical protein [Halorubrum]ELZ43845.1 hypothetical protein C463_09274 [Halorubrum californiense DSM 19288]TKX69319.1 hypothetical protein EXE40_10960 [Halorubrum sp. GN11GM_10-3_MGM]
MSLAAETREAVRARPFLRDALRAGLVNHSAAATWLAERAGLDGDSDAIAAALRRFREDLPAYETDPRAASVTMRSGVGVVDDASDGDGNRAGESLLLRVGDAAVVDGGDRTAILATGDVDVAALANALGRLAAADVDIAAAGVAGDALVCVVSRRDGANAVRVVEAALDAVPVDEN